MSKRRSLITDSGSNGSEDTPTTDEVRKRLELMEREAMQAEENTCIRSPTSSGKTYTIATTPWRDYPDITGGQPVIHLSPTRDARQSAIKKNGQSEATGQKLLGRTEACPIAGGDHDDMDAPDGSVPSDWFRRMCEDRGFPFSYAHGEFKRAHDGPLPCQPCDGVHQWNNMPRKESGEPSSDVTADF